MKVLFVSGTTGGGSGRSQRELAATLMRRGNSVTLLVDDKGRAPLTRWLYGQLSDLSVRTSSSVFGRVVERLRDSIAVRPRSRSIDGLSHLITPLPQNALLGVLHDLRSDVVVANSLERWAWRLIHQQCEAAGVPTILYIREEDSLAHLDAGEVPDILVANTPSLANTLRARGFACSYVPSLVDTSVTRTESTRRVVLAINPIAIKGVDIVLQVAERLRDIPFVLQEAWPLPESDATELKRHLRAVPNVTFRRASPPGPHLYGDTKLLMAPYRVDSRPRVVLEAQANGLPVVASDIPALVEAVGAGGVIVPIEDVDQWVDAVTSIWRDDELYGRLADAAVEHSRRADAAPENVADRFEELLHNALLSRALKGA